MQQPNPERLLKLANMRMPFGRYKGRALIDLPEPYVVWMNNEASLSGELGELFRELYDIKANGLESLIKPFQRFNDTDR